jgi:streptogramin lyase
MNLSAAFRSSNFPSTMLPMSKLHRGIATAFTATIALAAAGACVRAQVTRDAPSTSSAAMQSTSSPDMAPVNDLPNPYRTIEGWAKMPAGRTWGSTSAVEIDPDGRSIWVGERCGANSCRDSANVDPILKFDQNGNLVKSFGKGMLIFPHGIHIDRDGNLWVTDGQSNAVSGRGGRGGSEGAAPAPPPAPATRGMQVYKFSPDGQLLLTLGVPGGVAPAAAGTATTDYFYQPNAVLTLPNGEILVAEGHGGENARILRFAKDGRYIESWGKKGSGPLEFDQPHALAMDSRGRIFVGDRSNNRIQILDQTGKLLDTWYQFSRPSGIYIDRNDVIYVADSESGSVGNGRPRTWKRGIRIGSARTGEVTAFIPDPEPSPPSTSSAEGVAVDRNGVIYGAEVGQKALKRYIK